ncbi:MAG: Sco1/SenC family protein [Moraxellaceae bacterium]|nr:Sco1/SenC family protein [Moraxellaceae bacterium]
MNAVLKKRIAAGVAAALVLTLVTLLVLQWRVRQQALERLPVNSRMGGDFVLPSTLGQPLDTRTLRGKIVLLNFGFTSCPDVCPMVLARLRQTVKELGEDAGGVQVVFVSFDPARDSLPVLKDYVRHFNPAFIGATGTDVQVAQTAARYGVVFLKEKGGSAAGYGFAHSDYIYLLDGEGRVRKLYAGDARTTEIAEDVRLLQRAARGIF